MLRITIQTQDKIIDVIDVLNVSEDNGIEYGKGEQVYEVQSKQEGETSLGVVRHEFEWGYQPLVLKALKTLWHKN